MVLPMSVPAHSGGQRIDARMAKNYVLFCSSPGGGRGFDSSLVRATHGRKGPGLIAIKERVTAIGGTLHMGSRSGYRTELSMRLPLEGGHANSNCAR